ncbi:hypothetical protein [Candidatus Jidaibacter acanthamoebae]|nr:hypothetical protein [Candidatus Jidaibacter acanthamoeba]
MKEKEKEVDAEAEAEAEAEVEIEEESLFNTIEHDSFYTLNNEEKLKFQNTIIFVSNSELDGFREGDGDLMDKLVAKFNEIGINTIRVIENKNFIPEDKLALIDKKQIISIGDHAILSTKKLQERLLEILKNDYNDKDKIFYIGSRLDEIDITSEQPIQRGSGSLFTQDFIKELKSLNVKIVVNCLEYKFFKRSLEHFPKAVEMLRQQLFLADKIHFLNTHDITNYEKTIDDLKRIGHLRPHRLIPLDEVEKLEEGYTSLRDIKNWKLNLDQQKRKGVFISGIYTVDPISEELILGARTSSVDSREEEIIDILVKRPNNILCFGLIRGEKGILESIGLSKLFAENHKPNKVIIAGKLMDSFLLYKKILKEIFISGDNDEEKKGYERMFNKELNGIIKEYTADEVNLNSRKTDPAKLFTSHQYFNNDYDKINGFCQNIFNVLSMKYPGKVNNIEIHFNKSEQELRNIGMKCKYAMKLDHKGMANNASTIASCLGFYLPTFTASGLVTGDEFRQKESHRIKAETEKEFSHKYQQTVIMPKKEYSLNRRGQYTEIKPVNYSIQQIYEKIVNEPMELYIERLRKLRDLYKEGTFKVENVVINLIQKIFSPLREEHAVRCNLDYIVRE